MIQLYSRKQFTYEDDVLPALSGITNRVRGAGKYYGGLWEENLPHDLLWFSAINPLASKTEHPSFRSKYIAPSFLWASVKGQIAFVDSKPNTQNFKQTFAIIETSLLPKGEDPLGQLSDGCLTLKGPILRAKLTCSFERPIPADLFIKDVDPGQECRWAVLEMPDLESRDRRLRHYVWHPDGLVPRMRHDAELLCLQLFENNVDDRCYALVLSLSPSVTYRLGIIATIEKHHFHSAPVEPVTIR
jgi:hypothetical protein